MSLLVKITPIQWMCNGLVYVMTSGLQNTYNFVSQPQITWYIPNLPSIVPYGETSMSTEVLQFCWCQLSYFYMISHTKNWLCTANYCNSTLFLIFIWGDKSMSYLFFSSYAASFFGKFLYRNIFMSLKYILIVRNQHCYLYDNDVWQTLYHLSELRVNKSLK